MRSAASGCWRSTRCWNCESRAWERERYRLSRVHGSVLQPFHGQRIRSFSNVALKLRPIGVRFKDFAVEYNIRFYSNRFTPDEFGQPALPTTNGMAEAVHSFSFLIPLGKKKMLPAAP